MPWQNGLEESEIKYDQTQTASFRNWYYKLHKNNNKDIFITQQELDNLPEGFEVPEGRTKPWGTGQAVLCCKDVVKEPFVIINADDYYGKEAFVKLHDFLVSGEDLGREFTMGMGFRKAAE